MLRDGGLENRLSKKAVIYWRIEELFALVIAVLFFGCLLGCGLYWDWSRWLMYGFITLLALSTIFTIFALFTMKKKYQHWTYRYDDRFFYIREGVFIKRLVVLPFEKIQAVILIEGFLLNQLGLAAIELQGIEKVYSLPALEKETAIQIQQELAELTRQKGAAVNETISTTPFI